MKRFKFLPPRKKTEPEAGPRTPVWFGNYGNGEFFHEQTPKERQMHAEALRRAEEGARRLGMDRRDFLASAAGLATTLSVINTMGCGSGTDGGGAGTDGGGDAGTSGDGGGFYDTGTDPLDAGEQCEVALDPNKEFIFDIQSHHVNRADGLYGPFLASLPQGMCGGTVPECMGQNAYISTMFLESSTTVAVLSGVPALDEVNPLTNDEIAESRNVINMMAGSQRSVNHVMVLPNYELESQLEGMDRLHREVGVGAWKCYTPWAPGNPVSGASNGFWLTDEAVGIPFIEKARELNVKVFCCHKGLPLPSFAADYCNPRDIPVVAKAYPDCNFIVYHSAYGFGGNAEGPYVNGSMQGINSLITTMMANGIGPNENVYGELGSTWYSVMRDTTKAAHVIGKLLKYVGEDNVVWGTDSIWYGSPQQQIDLFLRFEISERFQSDYGYPALTNEIKRKILGLNAARVYGIDANARRCEIDQGQLATLKRNLDGELGARRWVQREPLIQTRRQFLDHVRLHRFLNLPG